MSVLDTVFNPRSIAIVGISITQPNHWTNAVLEGLLHMGYEGKLYLVNRNGGETEHLMVYRSLQDIPETPDYVIGRVSAPACPQLLRDCAVKGVKVVQFVTAGFSETGEEEGRLLQDNIVTIANETGIRVIGPNCMGIYCPNSKLSFSAVFPREAGRVGFIGQSGGNTSSMVRYAAQRGVRFSKVVSYGNACDLNETDFLEYLADDSETEIIGMYMEGVRDGRKFRHALEKAVNKKPVILLKGGFTPGGSRAVASHTGALAGSERIWDALCRQLGVIQVSSLSELIDVLVTFLFFRPIPRGRNGAFIGAGGGSSVLITDAFERRGLIVPPLPDNLYQKLREFTQAAGNMLRNPLDIVQGVDDIRHHQRIADLILGWQDIDFIVRFVVTSNAVSMSGLDQFAAKMFGQLFTGTVSSSKPLAVVVSTGTEPTDVAFVDELIRHCRQAGLAVYDSFDAAAAAIDLVLRYHEGKYGELDSVPDTWSH